MLWVAIAVNCLLMFWFSAGKRSSDVTVQLYTGSWRERCWKQSGMSCVDHHGSFLNGICYSCLDHMNICDSLLTVSPMYLHVWLLGFFISRQVRLLSPWQSKMDSNLMLHFGSEALKIWQNLDTWIFACVGNLTAICLDLMYAFHLHNLSFHG